MKTQEGGRGAAGAAGPLPARLGAVRCGHRPAQGRRARAARAHRRGAPSERAAGEQSCHARFTPCGTATRLASSSDAGKVPSMTELGHRPAQGAARSGGWRSTDEGLHRELQVSRHSWWKLCSRLCDRANPGPDAGVHPVAGVFVGSYLKGVGVLAVRCSHCHISRNISKR